MLVCSAEFVVAVLRCPEVDLEDVHDGGVKHIECIQ